jgi:hypothetical protein
MTSSVPGKRESGLRIRVAPESVALASWPLRDRPLRAWALLAAVAGASLLVGRFAPSVLYGWLALAILALTSWRNWLPVRFEINSNGVTETAVWRTRRIPWTAVAQHEIHREGVLLLPDAAVNALSPLRGLYVPWGSRRQDVLANLEYYLSPWSGESRSSIHPSR